MVISDLLNSEQELQLLNVLRKHIDAIGWVIHDIRGISPLICTHRLHLKENTKPVREMQRRLNPALKEIVKREIL
ncbi:hypothetical protein K8353_49000, partial [Burkholderia contaminans]|nr:hypothetical protein [Burkholderia contaminans]